jgi:hypothetical protein
MVFSPEATNSICRTKSLAMPHQRLPILHVLPASTRPSISSNHASPVQRGGALTSLWVCRLRGIDSHPILIYH